MPIHERSQFGCRTCRVRKKKCDERNPICSACDNRRVPCYGYGPKPGWMDGGKKERKVVEALKSIIKQTLKEKRLHRPAPPTQSISTASFRYGESPLPLVASTPTLSHTTESPSQISLNPYHCDYTNAASLPSPPSPPNSGSESHYVVRTRGLEGVENSLLMDYLGHAFPLQFNFYSPLVAELGRGWLLTLLTRTKPLYHTALALSDFYMYLMLLKTGRTSCINGNWEVMRMNYERAFSELQIQLRSMRVGDLKSTIETAACVIQLISFELLREEQTTGKSTCPPRRP